MVYTQIEMKMVVIFFLSLVIAFMWKVFFLQKVAFPGDLLVGAYYPWKINVPIKNPLISDVFSQVLPWKKLAVDNYKIGKLPLWNPYTFSGYPLMANLHSGSIYPLNIFMAFDLIWGWHLLLASQFVIGSLGMYFLCRCLGSDKPSSVLASIVFAFSGFSLVWWQVVHAGHALAWLPWLIVCVEKRKSLIIPFVFFLLFTAGHFQMATYSLIVLGVYWLYFSRNKLWQIVVVIVACLGVVGVQIIPTLKMSSLSVRFSERYIQNENYGLLPFSNLVKLVLPDFYGNPTTGNYWGINNYMETVVYVGTVAFAVLGMAILNITKLDRRSKFFAIAAVFALLLATDSFAGRLIYQVHIPGLSTSSAGRVIGVFCFFVSVLIGLETRNLNWKYPVLSGLIFGLFGFLSNWQNNWLIIARNSVLPIVFMVITVLCLKTLKSNARMFVLIIVSVVELFRFGWKFNPFTHRTYWFPKSPEIDFLIKDRSGFKIATEYGPVMPANTWEYYGISNVAGYDPLVSKEYSIKFQKELNNNPNTYGTRYNILSRYDASKLAEHGVKYLLARTGEYKSNSDIDLKEWAIASEYPGVTILRNTKFVQNISSLPEKWVYDTFYAGLALSALTATGLVWANYSKIV